MSALEVTDGAPVGNIAHPNSRVLCSAPDGQGGWFIGGDFTEVGGLQRTRLAHLNAQGQQAQQRKLAGELEWAQLQGETAHARRERLEASLSAHRALIELQRLTGETSAPAARTAIEEQP